jgi:hypothetical protein
MTIAPPIDFAAEYKLDRNGRLRYSSGAGRGQYAPRSATLALEARSIALQKAELQTLGDRVSSGQMTLRDFQQEAGELLRKLHASSAICGRGGLDKMSDRDWLAIGRLLKVQYYDGKDAETDRRLDSSTLPQNSKREPLALRCSATDWAVCRQWEDQLLRDGTPIAAG